MVRAEWRNMIKDFESMYYEITNEIGVLPFGETYLDWIKVAKRFMVKGNYYNKQIAELQEKLSFEQTTNKLLNNELMGEKDKLHRRNLQIADLKKKLRMEYIRAKNDFELQNKES